MGLTMKKLKLTFFSDSGHGWLAVKRDLLESLGIADKITSCSYIRGGTIYLEEDQDASTFFNAYRASLKSTLDYVDFRSTYLTIKDSYKDYSPIRSYAHYSPKIIKKFEVDTTFNYQGIIYRVVEINNGIKVQCPRGKVYTLKDKQKAYCYLPEVKDESILL